jgi:Holliday junction resolvase
MTKIRLSRKEVTKLVNFAMDENASEYIELECDLE